MAAITLDRIDRLLLAERQRSACRTNAELAERVQLSASARSAGCSGWNEVSSCARSRRFVGCRCRHAEHDRGCLGNVRDYGRRGLAPVLATCKARFHVAISLAGARLARTDAAGGAEEDG